MSKNKSNENIFRLKDGKPVSFEKNSAKKKDGMPQIRSMAVSREHVSDEDLRKSVQLIRQFQDESDGKNLGLLEDAIMLWPYNFFAWSLRGDYSVFESEAYVFYKEAYSILDQLIWGSETKKISRNPQNSELLDQYGDIADKYAFTLLSTGKYMDAILVFEKLINALPEDPYEMKHPLMLLYILMEERERYRKIYMKYKDDYSVFFLYNKLLFEYTESPDSLSTQAALTDALEVNKYVPEKMSDWAMAEPHENPEEGSPEEAENFAGLYGKYWDMFPGAIRWLREESKKRK